MHVAQQLERFYSLADTAKSARCRMKRRLMSGPLADGSYSTIRALVLSVGGNTRDQAWVSELVRAGEIMIIDGRLRLPAASPKKTLEKVLMDLQRALDAACDHTEPGLAQLARKMSAMLDDWCDRDHTSEQEDEA